MLAWLADGVGLGRAPAGGRSLRWRAGAAAFVACGALLSGCEESSNNTGLLVDYLEGSSGHFTGPTQRLAAQLKVDGKGCVTVVIDGVERMPFWPSGTEVTDSAEAPGNYTVSLGDGIELRASRQTGDRFVADGIIDDNPAAFSSDPTIPGLVDSRLSFCGVPNLPVAFYDSSSFELE